MQSKNNQINRVPSSLNLFTKWNPRLILALLSSMPNRTVMGTVQAQIPLSLNLSAFFYSRNSKLQYPSRVMELRHCNLAEH